MGPQFRGVFSEYLQSYLTHLSITQRYSSQKTFSNRSDCPTLLCVSGMSTDISLARKCVHHFTISELLCNLYGHSELSLYSTTNFAIFIGTILLASGFCGTLKAQWSLEEEQNVEEE